MLSRVELAILNKPKVAIFLDDNDWSGTIPSEVGSLTLLRKSNACYTPRLLRGLISRLNDGVYLSFNTLLVVNFVLSGPSIDGTIPTQIGMLSNLGLFITSICRSLTHGHQHLLAYIALRLYIAKNNSTFSTCPFKEHFHQKSDTYQI